MNHLCIFYLINLRKTRAFEFGKSHVGEVEGYISMEKIFLRTFELVNF